MITQSTIFEGVPGDRLSLFSLTPICNGVTTKGLKYPLENDTLHLGSSRGLSNEFISEKARVSIKDGHLLSIKVSQRT